MTTEKEFWEFAGRYFRTLTSIQNIIDELKVSGGLSKDVRAIKAMKRVENVMKEFDEQKLEQSTIKQQNQTLLHICAELEAIKQCDPFDSVFIAYSIENISNIIKGGTIIDEECVGCAGPCKVVDVAAKLQKELDSTIGQLVDSRKRCDYLSTKIEDLKDSNIEDLHELYDLDKEDLDRLKNVISARDLSIKSLTTMCQSSGSIRKDLASTIEDQKRTIDHFINYIGGLEAELSARKEDSRVLMKVVGAVRDWQADPINPRHMIERIRHITENCLDAPEGPPETPIDDLYRVTVTYTFLEMP